MTYVLIKAELYFNFDYFSMGFCGIGYYVTSGILALNIMALGIIPSETYR